MSSVWVIEAVCDLTAREGFDTLFDGLDLGTAAGVCLVSLADAAVWMQPVELAYHRVEALRVPALAAVEAGRCHCADGHFFATKMLEHYGCLSHGCAQAVESTRRMFCELSDIKAVFDTGGVGVDQVRVLAKVFGNKRARDAMTDAQPRFLEQAKLLPYRDFAQVVREWE